MKKLLLILFILSSFNSKGTIHQIGVWGGYYQFVPASITIQLGDTLEWEPYFGMLPTMLHTITSDNIPVGAVSFDQVWQMPADTFFQYIPQVAGLYQYVCTPHILNGMIAEFTVTNGASTQTYVPDDNFEQALINLGYDNVLDDYVTTSNINTVTTLFIYNQNILDITGIEGFTSLVNLECNDNQISTLDLSSNIALEHLGCWNNQISLLNISNNLNLVNLSVHYNQLLSIDVSNHILLEVFSCSNNQISFLDVNNNPSLTGLECNNNQISSLDVSQNINLMELYCSDNQITSLDISSNTVLNNLNCFNNHLIFLNLNNGNNIHFVPAFSGQFYSNNNPNLFCIKVDDVAWSTINWTVANGNIDAQHYFSTNCSATFLQEHSSNKELLKVTGLLGRETKQTNQPLFYIYDDGTVEKRITIE